MVKRIITLLLALSLLGSICIASGSEPPVVSAEGIFVKPGGSAELDVNISGNTGLSAFCITVRCDTEIFSLEADEENGGFMVQCGEIFSSGSIFCVADGTKGWKITWYAPVAVKEDGNMFTLNINAKEGTAKGEYPVAIGYEAKNTLDGELNKAPLKCMESTINVLPTDAVFEVRKLEAMPGKQAMIEVCITENPGIAAFELYIGCSSDIFDAIPEDGGGYKVLPGEIDIGGSFVANKLNSKTYRVLWFSTIETIKTGCVLRLPVNVSEKAEGEYELTLSLNERNITNGRYNVVPATAVGSSVKTVSVACSEPVVEIGDESVSVTVNISTKEEKVLVTAGIYSSNSRMLGIKTMEVSANSDEEEVKLAFTSQIDEASYIKIFFLKEGGWAALVDNEHIDLAGTEEAK